MSLPSTGSFRREGKGISKVVENAAGGDGGEGSAPIVSSHAIGVFASVVCVTNVAFLIWVFCLKDDKMKIPIDTLSLHKRRSILKRGCGDYLTKVDAVTSGSVRGVTFTCSPDIHLATKRGIFNETTDLRQRPRNRKVPSQKSVSFGPEVDIATQSDKVNYMPQDCHQISLGQRIKRTFNTANQTSTNITKSSNKGKGDVDTVVKDKYNWHLDGNKEGSRLTASTPGYHQNDAYFVSKKDVLKTMNRPSIQRKKHSPLSIPIQLLATQIKHRKGDRIIKISTNPIKKRNHSSFKNSYYNGLSLIGDNCRMLAFKKSNQTKPHQTIDNPSRKRRYTGRLSSEGTKLDGYEVTTKDLPPSHKFSGLLSDSSTAFKDTISNDTFRPHSYHIGDNFSNTESAKIHREEPDPGGNPHKLASTTILKTLNSDAIKVSICTENKKCCYKKHPRKMYYRQRKLTALKPKPMTETSWSQLATNSIFYDYEPQFYLSDLPMKKTKNTNDNARARKCKDHNHNSIREESTKKTRVVVSFGRKLHYLTLKRKAKATSKLVAAYQKPRAISCLNNLNKNTNAQHSDTDLREENAREKKPETVSSTSASSVVSADAFFSTRTDMADGCEETPSMVLLVEKAAAEFSPEYAVKGHASRSSNNIQEAIELQQQGSPVDGLEIIRENKPRVLDGTPDVLTSEEQKCQDGVLSKKSGKYTLSELTLNSSEDEGGRHSKKVHKPQSYACLFPSKSVADRNVDGIDSVVLDCMRNALTEVVAQVEKCEPSGKPPVTPENQHRSSSCGHRKRCPLESMGVSKLKTLVSKKASVKGAKEDITNNVSDEMSTDRSKVIIAKVDAAKEIYLHGNLKTSTVSTPNLPSVGDARNESQGVSQFKMQEANMGPDELAACGADEHKSAHNRKREKSKSGQKKTTISDGVITERPAEADGDTGNVGESERAFQMKDSSMDIESLALNSRDIAPDEISLLSETKSVGKSNKRASRRGRSPRKKQQETLSSMNDLASILTTSRENGCQNKTDDNEITKEIDVAKKKMPLIKLKKSVSLSPQGIMQSRKLSLTEHHQSASHGNIIDLPRKSKGKSSKKSSKKKRVRIAPVHDDSPVRRRRKPQSASPVCMSENTPPSKVKQTNDEDNIKKDIKKAFKSSRSPTPKTAKNANEIEVSKIESKTVKIVHVESDSLYPFDESQSSEELNFDINTMVELHAEQFTPVHNLPSLTELSEKANNVKVIVMKTPLKGKASKQEKDLQSAETGWNGKLVGNTSKTVCEVSKAQKKKNYRKMYKLVKPTNKDHIRKEDHKGRYIMDTMDVDSDGIETVRSENGDEMKSTETGKESALPQPKKSHVLKKDNKSKDFLHTSEHTPKSHFGRRPALSPKSSHIKHNLNAQEGELSNSVYFKEEMLEMGSSVDKREIDDGSSVDAPTYHRKDPSLRLTRSGPALGVGKNTHKEMDSAAKRVKFARENAMNLAKQARKNLMNSTSPGLASINQLHPSPVQKREECSKLGQNHVDDQVSPMSCRSTDLDLAAGFKRSRSPSRPSLSGRYSRRDNKTIKSAPKLDVRVEECSCATATSSNRSSRLLPACDSSTDYNVINLGLNWIVQGFINRISFLRPTTEHNNCSGTTAAGDSTNQQVIPTSSSNI